MALLLKRQRDRALVRPLAQPVAQVRAAQARPGRPRRRRRCRRRGRRPNRGGQRGHGDAGGLRRRPGRRQQPGAAATDEHDALVVFGATLPRKTEFLMQAPKNVAPISPNSSYTLLRIATCAHTAHLQVMWDGADAAAQRAEAEAGGVRAAE